MSLCQNILCIVILLQFTNAGHIDANSFITIIPPEIRETFKQVEYRRRKIKNAFYKFINDAFNDETEILRKSQDIEDSISTPELIALHGYRRESHTVATEDGYLLTLQRILPVNENSSREVKLALLHHGLLGSSDDWILIGSNKALPYMLSDAGYDVWLTNARGNKYSRIHTSKKYDSPEFWDFSWHEIGSIDLAAVIDFINKFTRNKSKINFIGHSMGATALLVLLSEYPHYNKVLKSAILLAPLVFMQHIKGPLQTIAKYYRTYTNHDDDDLNLLGNKDFSQMRPFPLLIDQFCKGDKTLCNNALLLLTSGGQNICDKEIKSNVLTHLPDGGSTKTILHYGQLAISGQFQQFDYGFTNNTNIYGTETPPDYQLANVVIPIAVIRSNDDWLSTGPDIDKLLEKVPHAFVYHTVERYAFSHMDFVFSADAPTIVYPLILDILQ